MENGYLAQYFNGIATKKLSQVEADTFKSNQHEYNGDRGLKKLLGIESGRRVYIASFIYMGDDDIVNADGTITWYDARENHPFRSEWRLYFSSTGVSAAASVGDTLYICKKPDETVLVIIVQKDSTIESQLCWLFDIVNDENHGFLVKDKFLTDKKQIEFVSRVILEQIGVEVEVDSGENNLEEMLHRFEGKFPTTKEFSKYARETVREVSPIEEPDSTLLKWINQEEILFRMLEKHMISERLREGFTCREEIDVDGFVKFSLSVQNRRKSRVGQAFENHVEKLLIDNSIKYSRTPVTENKSKPDFIFPSIEAYRDTEYDAAYLTMLGVKSTCKDRWRQILAESDRIERKHLLTLEAAISENQTNEMIAKDLRLVIPKDIHSTYSKKQQDWICNVEDFLKEVREKQHFS